MREPTPAQVARMRMKQAKTQSKPQGEQVFPFKVQPQYKRPGAAQVGMWAELPVVPEDYKGVRVDKWIRCHYPSVPQGVLQRLGRVKCIKVQLDDGADPAQPRKVLQCSDRLQAGWRVRVRHDMSKYGESHAQRRARARGQGGATEAWRWQSSATHGRLRGVEVLYEDPDMLVLNKPTGLAVQPGSGLDGSLQDWLDANSTPSRQLRLVHRLDKDASGCVIVATSRTSAQALSDAFRDRRVRKAYVAVASCGDSTLADFHDAAELEHHDSNDGDARSSSTTASGAPAPAPAWLEHGMTPLERRVRAEQRRRAQTLRAKRTGLRQVSELIGDIGVHARCAVGRLRSRLGVVLQPVSGHELTAVLDSPRQHAGTRSGQKQGRVGLRLQGAGDEAEEAAVEAEEGEGAAKPHVQTELGQAETEVCLVKLHKPTKRERRAARVGLGDDRDAAPSQAQQLPPELEAVDAPSMQALLVLRPVTGLKHQLRAQCLALRAPIVGDAKYGYRRPRTEGGGGGAVPLHLHAAAVAVPTRGGREVTVQAPLPKHMVKTMGRWYPHGEGRPESFDTWLRPVLLSDYFGAKQEGD